MGLMTAVTAKSNITSSPNVIQEIAVLSVAVANAIDNNATSVNITSSSTVTISGSTVTGSLMTAGANADDYYNTYAGVTTDAIRTAEMQAVIDYFTALSYAISRKSNNSTTFYWTISWA